MASPSTDCSAIRIDVSGDVDAQLDAGFEAHVRPHVPSAYASQVKRIVRQSIAGDVSKLLASPDAAKSGGCRVLVKLLDGTHLRIPVRLSRSREVVV